MDATPPVKAAHGGEQGATLGNGHAP